MVNSIIIIDHMTKRRVAINLDYVQYLSEHDKIEGCVVFKIETFVFTVKMGMSEALDKIVGAKLKSRERVVYYADRD